ncbi:hypothetical protein BDV39DRAFT_187868 [Aspergillus sergii]|uniref:Secreted protein n=1 Tax=Aspergillus sergii TaxID=1034303 RepID=A0A5N6WIF8_9EURO|nr:hypothetical protein BDV39DRAFT_187868 [Aspergillus sergii]
MGQFSLLPLFLLACDWSQKSLVQVLIMLVDLRQLYRLGLLGTIYYRRGGEIRGRKKRNTISLQLQLANPRSVFATKSTTA